MSLCLFAHSAYYINTITHLTNKLIYHNYMAREYICISNNSFLEYTSSLYMQRGAFIKLFKAGKIMSYLQMAT